MPKQRKKDANIPKKTSKAKTPKRFRVSKPAPVRTAAKKTPPKKTSVGKIYKTTDGNLGGDKTNTKPRRVIAVEQRKTDGAIAVTKIHKKEGKDPKDRSRYIQDVELDPRKHPS